MFQTLEPDTQTPLLLDLLAEDLYPTFLNWLMWNSSIFPLTLPTLKTDFPSLFIENKVSLIISKIPSFRTSLVVQWLRFWAFNAREAGSIPGQGTKIPHAVHFGQKKKKKKKD